MKSESVCNNRHAYLIMAHHDFEMLKKLLVALDDERNDIFLLIDRKSDGFSKTELMSCVRKSNIFWAKQKSMTWGDYSLVKGEMSLLKMATDAGKYRYYHLLSGQDFPIHNQNYIHGIFDKSDMEYITSWDNMPEVSDARNYTDAYRYYYWFNCVRFRHKEGSFPFRLFTKLDEKSRKFQKKHNIARDKSPDVKIYKGDQWFSITDDFARFVLCNYSKFEKYLKYTMAPDEFIIPTIANNSEYKDKIAFKNYRLIDWERGSGKHPYCFCDNDYNDIISSDKLFVRKVSSEESSELISKLSEYISNE